MEVSQSSGWEIGGAEEDRTPDLRIANATLSQLSYRPVFDAYFTGEPDRALQPPGAGLS